MARFYVEHNGEWNIFSTIVDDFLFDEFVCIDALKARLLYERFKELTEDIDSLMTDRPKVNVMPYEEAVRIADRKTEPITHDDYIESETGYLEARCLNCNNAKACKEKHWSGCVYEPKDEKTCESCIHWKYIAKEWQCEATKCQGYEPKDEPQTERSNE